MATLTAALVLPSELKPSFSSHRRSLLVSRRRPKKNHPAFPVRVLFFFFFFFSCVLLNDLVEVDGGVTGMDQVARLFGPAIFEASKLKVLFLGVDDKKHPGKLPRTYTLTHSDITAKLTLAISQTINNSQVIITPKPQIKLGSCCWFSLWGLELASLSPPFFFHELIWYTIKFINIGKQGKR